jgi:hypothetical protein
VVHAGHVHALRERAERQQEDHRHQQDVRSGFHFIVTQGFRGGSANRARPE